MICGKKTEFRWLRNRLDGYFALQSLVKNKTCGDISITAKKYDLLSTNTNYCGKKCLEKGY